MGFSGALSAFEPIVQVEISNPSKPTIAGTTNLPDGTPLMVTIEVARRDSANPDHIIYPMLDELKATVHDGHFEAGPFGSIYNKGGEPYDRGSYLVSVAISTGALPDNAAAILGEMGAKISGPNVTEGLIGPYFEMRTRFEVR
jgi:hypothetical protein